MYNVNRQDARNQAIPTKITTFQ